MTYQLNARPSTQSRQSNTDVTGGAYSGQCQMNETTSKMKSELSATGSLKRRKPTESIKHLGEVCPCGLVTVTYIQRRRWGRHVAVAKQEQET